MCRPIVTQPSGGAEWQGGSSTAKRGFDEAARSCAILEVPLLSHLIEPPPCPLAFVASMKYQDTTSVVGPALRTGLRMVAFFAAIVAWPCNWKDAIADDGIQFFETHIRPVLVEHCYECHSLSSGKSQGELLLDSREAMREGGGSGPAIVPGELDASLLLDAIRYESFEMPPKGKLDAATIEKFEQWVRMGAPDPREQVAVPVGTPGGLAKVDWEAAKEYWSFKPREQVIAPEIVNDRVRGPVDAFVWATLNESKLQAVEETSRENWLRRVTFDLIGLPPTPEQLESFLKDDRPTRKSASWIDCWRRRGMVNVMGGIG